MSTLENSIKILTATPPPATGLINPRQAYARVIQLETELGIAPSMPILNLVKANARIVELESIRSAKAKLMPAPDNAASAVVAAVIPGTDTDESPILKATLAEWRKMEPAHRSQFMADGGALALVDFQALTSRGKMDFMRGGGRILEAVQEDMAARAAAAKVQKPAATDPAKIKPAADFAMLSPKAKMDFMRAGGKIID